MNILQLCCFTNLWSDRHTVESYDLRIGKNVFDLDDRSGKYFDLVVAAPPCDQFTKANSLNWVDSPGHFIDIAEKCFKICLSTGGLWFLENPPGRIEKFIPALTEYRMLTWSGGITNKEYVIYSNFIPFSPIVKRYGRSSNSNMTKKQREAWQPDFINAMENCIQNN